MAHIANRNKFKFCLRKTDISNVFLELVQWYYVVYKWYGRCTNPSSDVNVLQIRSNCNRWKAVHLQFVTGICKWKKKESIERPNGN